MTDMTEKKKKHSDITVKKVLLTLAGALIYAAGLGMFLDPNKLSAGGVAGIALLIDHLLPGVGVGILILILNIPILLFGMWKFGKRFMVLTVLALAVSSPLADVLQKYLAPGLDDMLLNALVGGALLGVGMGLLFRAGASSGGMDIVTKYLHKKKPHMKMGILHLLLDCVILTLTLLVFRQLDIVLYAALGLFVSSYVMNVVLYGTDEARMVYIVSDRPRELADELLRHQNLGVTFLKGQGAYTGADKTVLLCVLRPKQLPPAREFVAGCDPKAFMIVTGASAVFGVGFKDYHAENL